MVKLNGAQNRSVSHESETEIGRVGERWDGYKDNWWWETVIKIIVYIHEITNEKA